MGHYLLFSAPTRTNRIASALPLIGSQEVSNEEDDADRHLSPLALSHPRNRGSADEAQAAFERLKSLAGNWEGMRQGEGGAEALVLEQGAPDTTHIFRIVSAGTVVMETMDPGGDQEMINMYHFDGNALMVTHYCASGNQPAMLLNPVRSTENELYFDFIGGTNFDPEVDQHIHSIEIDLREPDKIVTVFESYAGGERVGTMSFELVRN